MADAKQLQKIDRELLRGLPEWLREDCLEVLDQALNVRNRATKRWKIQSWGSEDQVTRVVFRFLQREQRLHATLAAAGVSVATEGKMEPAMLFWGVPVPLQDIAGAALRKHVVSVLEKIDKTPQSHTEPDVILDFGPDGLVFFEVKYESDNDLKEPGYSGWPLYLQDTAAFRDPEMVRKSRLYQLARNWRAGWDLAQDRPLTLVNLRPKAVVEESLQQFVSGLSVGGTRRFQELTWGQLLAAAGPLPAWLSDYLKLRKLL